jgi:3'-phosphoadenosine 5'-phosphosulfate sulfotransferase (PAPS reductase)/FAD synthetase
MARLVCWFSCGATSAVAAKLALMDAERSGQPKSEVNVVYIETRSEHPDNERFLRDIEQWIDLPIQRIGSGTYFDTWDVFRKTRWLVGPKGARCTTELKKLPRRSYQRDGDVQVFGFDAGEQKRVTRFIAENPEVTLSVPLVVRGLSKADCLAILERSGIQLPAMYRLGFQNANCLGCPKGGMGYWNRIRREFPEVFARMAAMEREIGASICKKEGPKRKRIPVFLDELDPSAGSDKEIMGECSVFCSTAEAEITQAQAELEEDA